MRKLILFERPKIKARVRIDGGKISPSSPLYNKLEAKIV